MFLKPIWGANGGGPSYEPGMMTFDGSTGYYSKSVVAPTQNLITFVCRFNTATKAAEQIICWANGASSRLYIRASVAANDHSDSQVASKILYIVRDTSGTPLLAIVSKLDVDDGQDHTMFVAFDADAGTVIFYIDGIDADNTSYTNRTLTTGNPANGTGLVFIGANDTPASYFDGDIGFIGWKHVYLTNPLDFMTVSGPKELDESTWTEWGAQPEFWNNAGTMTANAGSGGNMAKTGTITGPT